MVIANLLDYVQTFKYLVHMIANTLSDHDDIKHEIRNMFTKSNILVGRFAKCSVAMKVELLKVYCICPYDARFALDTNKLMSCYNKCLKLFLQYKCRDRVTQTPLDAGLSSSSSVMYNSVVISDHSWCGGKSEEL